MAARPISVRLPDAMIEAMDAAVANSEIASRSELISTAIGMWLRADGNARIDAAIADGYSRIPPDAAEDAELLRLAQRARRDVDAW
jgi:Arc/MetJ-type ribon-helix-helix transcriptional regulator